MTRYIFVTGGVLSGLGKGITAASLGRLLKLRGLKVAAQKLDPYLNVDPGTMSPFQHGEVFVTDDGAETDLDLGHYERFIDEDLNKYSNMTSGKVYWNVLSREREGGYLGQTVQIIPHITDEIKRFINAVGEQDRADVVITEIGGTIGDIESQPFLEAVRQVAQEVGRSRCIFLHVTLVPYIPAAGEYKTKPTQHSVRELQSLGIAPDLIIARCDSPLTAELKRKIAAQCGVAPNSVISNVTMPGLYQVPGMLESQGISDLVTAKLGLSCPPPSFEEWDAMLRRAERKDHQVRIALVGKYTQLHDAYLSIVESLAHAGYENAAQVDIKWIEASDFEGAGCEEALHDCDGILVPGGFGNRGIEGMICAARYARENGVPYFGICLGLQIAVIEFARNVLGVADANSFEFAPDGANSVIALMPDQQGNIPKGGTMRLGAYPCELTPGTRAEALYGRGSISERHRHRLEVNNDYRDALAEGGLVIAGQSPDRRLVEIIELADHPFFIGVQFHPEFKSRPNRAHPIFRGFVEAAVRRAERESAIV
ncbi:MAG: CTP synthase [Oscillospiraceae bacterium]|jgi:CTP synthase|nr:CTP synthase [Oscillospiraceae bacterium]